MDTEANTINTAKIIIISNDFVTMKEPTVNTSEGMAGTMKALVAYTAIIEGIPKMMAVFKLISPFLYLGKAPTKLVEPTMNKE
jgi:hypothetical protein